MESGMNILVIEDNPLDVILLRGYLQDVADLKLEFADRLSTGLKRLSENHPNLVLLDLGLPDCQGLETLSRVFKVGGRKAIVVLTGLVRSLQAWRQ